MNQNWRAKDGSKRMAIERISVGSLGLIALLTLALMGSESHAAAGLRIAVAPFEGEQRASSLAKALTEKLALRDLERLIAPGDFVASAEFEPRAAEIRRWAHNSAVDTIVVGRVIPLIGEDKTGGRVIETVIRSGHSGAELARHEVVMPRASDLDRSVERLAVEILAELGFRESAPAAVPGDGTSPIVSSGRSNSDRISDDRANRTSGHPADPFATSPNTSGSEGRGLEFELSRSGFQSDAPIEIKADEAEIISQDQGRRLIFQRNVWVRQANVTLQSERLEASYRKGDSEPRELIAEGNVRITQNDRHAKCDQATYLREANQLTCRGRAELIQGCDIVRGDSIEFDLDGDQAVVEGAASIVIQPQEDGLASCVIDRSAL